MNTFICVKVSKMLTRRTQKVCHHQYKVTSYNVLATKMCFNPLLEILIVNKNYQTYKITKNAFKVISVFYSQSLHTNIHNTLMDHWL